jgi:hypothetical protein
LSKKGVGLLAYSDADVWCLICVSNSSETDFIGPEHKVAPIGLMIFKEFSVKLEVLSYFNRDVISLKSGVPLARSVGESAHRARNIIDGSLFSMEIFQLNFPKSSIFISWQQMNPTLRELQEKVARAEWLVLNVLELRELFGTFNTFFILNDQLQILWANFER